MTRTVPPEHHTRKLRELLVRATLAAPDNPTLTWTQHRNAAWVRALLRVKWEPGDELPPGTVSAYLNLRGITAPGARPAISAALHGRRVCPPGAAYAPAGWAEYLKEEAAKDKDVQP